jgi:hypothetical protein
MRVSLVAALGVAAGLVAGPALAATSGTHHHHHHASRSHMSARHHTRGGMANNPNAENAQVEQLNNMSLQAAQRGQNYTPPGGMGGAPSNIPHSGGMHR